MIVKVLYFGRLKELSGSSEESVEVRDGARIEDLFAHCSVSRPELRKFRASLVAARNREFAAWDSGLSAAGQWRLISHDHFRSPRSHRAYARGYPVRRDRS